MVVHFALISDLPMLITSFNRNRYLYFGILLTATAALVYFISKGALGAKEIGSALLAMIGTFAGAFFAFSLNESKARQKLESEEKDILNRCLFIVLRYYNAVHSLSKELERYKSINDRAFNCPAFTMPSYKDVNIDFVALNFLLDKEPKVVMRLSIEEEGFHQTLLSLSIRNDFYIKEIQPAIEKAGFNRRMNFAQYLARD